VTPPPEDDPPPPKRRRKPPKGLEGFDTGYPDEGDAAASDPTPTTTPSSPSGVVRKPIWSDSAPAPSASEPSPSAPAPEASVVVDPSMTPAEPVQPAPADAAAGGSYGGSYGGNYGGSPTGNFGSSYGGNYGASDPAAFPAYAPPTASGTTTTSLDRDEPLSSARVGTSDADLREAVGAKSKKKPSKRTPPPDVVHGELDDDDDLGDGRRRSRKMIAVAVIALVVGLGVAALVFLGRANSAWFYISCEPDKIVAQQGRSFPPWGESALGGKQWAAIKIPPEAECIPLETESEDELSDQFRAMLVKRASVLLTAKEVTKTGEAKAFLEQALLLARSNTDTARNAKAEIQRLLGDVAYWGASLKMRDASKALLEAAKDFDAAAQQRPRHVTDASAWAEYVRKVVGELESGPSGTSQTFPPTPPPTEPRTQAPPGVALPVEPGQGSASEAPQPTPPDAGLPTGGVLL
jgi:hypothetical protein